MRLFSSEEVIARVIDTLMDDAFMAQRERIFRFFTVLIRNSQAFIDAFTAFGGVQFLIGEMMKSRDPLFVNSADYLKYIGLLKNLLCETKKILGNSKALLP